MKIFTSVFLGILFIQSAFAQPFVIQNHTFLDEKIDSLDTKCDTLDFDGDGKLDIYVRGQEYSSRIYTHRVLGKYTRYYSRTAVFPTNELMEEFDFREAMLSEDTGTNLADSLVIAASNQVQVIQYLNDDSLYMDDRFVQYNYSLDMEIHDPQTKEFTNIDQIVMADVVGSSQFDDLIIVAHSDDGDPRLFIFDDPFDLNANQQDLFYPYQILLLPGIPTQFLAIAAEDNSKANLFFKYGREWYIWISDPILGGFEPDKPERSIVIPIPSGIKNAMDIIAGNEEYPYLMSVESEADSDIAYFVFPKDRLDNPIPVSIPDKHLQGTNTRLFQYKNTNTMDYYPILFVYNRLDLGNPQSNIFTLYKLDSNNLLSVQFMQSLVGYYDYDYSNGEYQIQCYIDHPVLVDDFDGNGVSDIVMALMKIQVNPETSDPFRYNLFGIPDSIYSTFVPDWIIYE